MICRDDCEQIHEMSGPGCPLVNSQIVFALVPVYIHVESRFAFFRSTGY